MANFTTSQVNSCTITKMEKLVDGSDIIWKIEFNDTLGNTYDIKLRTLGDNPSTSDIKTAVKNEVVDKMLKRDIAPAGESNIVITEVENKGMGETLG